MPNYAYIDSQNLVMSLKLEGWKLDFTKFRVYLQEKYYVSKAYLFVGFMQEYQPMYKSLQNSGFELIFKPTSANYYAKIKGSIDIELTMQVMLDYPRFEKAVMVTGDGDYYCLVDYLKKHNKLEKLLVPNASKYSKLLNSYASGRMDYMNNLKTKLEYVYVP